MAKFTVYDPPLAEEQIAQLRRKENLLLSPEQRMKKMFALMELSARFKKGPLKKTGKNAIVFKSKKYDAI